MRISDWSSDVCSSDLPGPREDRRVGIDAHHLEMGMAPLRRDGEGPGAASDVEQTNRRTESGGIEQRALDDSLAIGRASCRERECQYVEISVVAGPLKKK